MILACLRCHRPRINGWADFFVAFEAASEDERGEWAFLRRMCVPSRPCEARQMELFA